MTIFLFHTEYLIPGLLLLFALGVVALISIIQYVIKLGESRKNQK